MSVISKKLSLADVSRVFELEDDIFNNANIKAIEKAVTSDTSVYYVIEVDDVIVGFANIIVCIPEAEIVNIAIDKKYRGNGYSTMLLKHIIKDMPEVENIFLEVRESNIAAISLYENNGFVVIGKRNDYYKDNEDALIMRNTALL